MSDHKYIKLNVPLTFQKETIKSSVIRGIENSDLSPFLEKTLSSLSEIDTLKLITDALANTFSRFKLREMIKLTRFISESIHKIEKRLDTYEAELNTIKRSIEKKI